MVPVPGIRENQRARRGSVGRDKSGRWFYVFDRDPVNGRRRQVRRRGFKTRAEAHAAMAEAKADTGQHAKHPHR